jgi:hypothetical protein
MDFLKSAVASAMSKGPPFPYTFGDKIDVDQSMWTLYNGTKREDGSSCSIFSFDAVADRARLPLARNAVRKLRTLRHPGVIKVLDTVETDTYIYVATERLVPLRWHVKRKTLSPETIKWGLNSVAASGYGHPGGPKALPLTSSNHTDHCQVYQQRRLVDTRQHQDGIGLHIRGWRVEARRLRARE